MSNNYKTSSGRQVNKPGQNSSKTSALAKLKAAREGGVKQSEQYQVQEAESVFKNIDEGEYEDLVE
jgi:hypothetical protein